MTFPILYGKRIEKNENFGFNSLIPTANSALYFIVIKVKFQKLQYDYKC